MVRLRSTLIALIMAGLIVASVTNRAANAQALQCPEIVKQALQQVEQLCAAVGRGKMCYGNSAVTTESTGAALAFARPGDIADLSAVKRLTLSGYDQKTGTWGVVMMRVQAGLPDSAPGQAVTMILLGDTQFAPVAGSKGAQAYFFKTGSGTPGCKQMPANGMLLESPTGKQKAQLTLNGVDLSIGSRVYLTISTKSAQPRLEVYTLEGEVEVTVDGETQIASEGQNVGVPLDENFEADDVPSEPVEEDPPTIDALPVDLIDQLETEFEDSNGGVATPEAGDATPTPPESGNTDATPDAPASEPTPAGADSPSE